VDFLRHLQRRLLVDNQGGCFQVGCGCQTCGGRGGFGTRLLDVVELYFREPGNLTISGSPSNAGFQYLKLSREKEERGGYHSH
jgi:hypothetical protein